MAKINFDPELVRNIKIIYGDANLDDRTLKQLYQTWQTNPNIIRKTAQQKTKESYFDSPELYSNTRPTTPSPQVPENLPIKEVDYNDLRMVQDFNTAFKIARNRGLKQFKWKSTKANPSGLFAAVLKKKVNGQPVAGAEAPVMMNPYVTYTNNGATATVHQNQVDYEGRMVGETAHQYAKTPSTDMYGNKVEVKQPWTPIPKTTVIPRTTVYQKGGAMNNQEELQKAFMAYLIQDAQAQGIQLQSEQDLQAYAEQLGEEGIKAKYQEFMQKMQGGMMARLGAKLEYYKKLKGVCPEGQELVYFKQGGRVCKACQKSQNGTKVDEKANAVDKFKAQRAYKKNINKDACGSKMKSNKRGPKKK